MLGPAVDKCHENEYHDMFVSEVMSTDLVSCPVGASLQDGVERMVENRVGSVVITDEGAPVGIVTETDALHAGHATERAFTEIPIRKVASHPLVTIAPDKGLRQATRRMENKGVKKLVVVEDLDVVGILTTQDIVDNYHDLKAEIVETVRYRPERELDRPTPDFEES